MNYSDEQAKLIVKRAVEYLTTSNVMGHSPLQMMLTIKLLDPLDRHTLRDTISDALEKGKEAVSS